MAKNFMLSILTIGVTLVVILQKMITYNAPKLPQLLHLNPRNKISLSITEYQLRDIEVDKYEHNLTLRGRVRNKGCIGRKRSPTSGIVPGTGSLATRYFPSGKGASVPT